MINRLVILWALILVLFLVIASCQRADVPASPADAPGDTSPGQERLSEAEKLSREVKAPVYIDPVTGCQYLGYLSHGLTPRMARDRLGGMYHEGCK